MEDQAPQSPFADDLASRSMAAIRELQSRAHAALSARREQMSRLEHQLDAQLDALEEAIAGDSSADSIAAEEAVRRQAEVERLREELTNAQSTWQQERQVEEERIAATLHQHADRESLLQQRDDDLRQREQELDTRVSELASRERSFEQTCSEQQDSAKLFAERELAWAVERASLEEARNEAAGKLELLASEHRAAVDAGKSRINEIEEKLRSQQSEWELQRSELESTRSTAEQERDKLAHELLANRGKLKAAEELSAAAGERDELKQKFELALADVQRFRASVAELEQELSRRPEAGGSDSAELIHLRAERDALAARVDALERQPAPPVDADQAQQVADLQRRFEMAVDDVRELKTKNAELESRLVSSRKQSISGDGDGGSMDWESQKRRLLASLEGEHGDMEPAREKERATIQHTIEMTDAVVTDKDLEIKELRAQLANRGEASQAVERTELDRVESLIDSDEVIAQHRERSAQLEKSLEETLRAAELELSIERAKLAREKAEVDEWRLEMETFHKARAADEPTMVAGAPRRRWLSKLGLNGDEKG